MMFYSFEQAKGYKNVWYNQKYVHSEVIHCPKYPGHQRGHRIARSLHVEFKSKKKADIYETSYSNWLIPDKVAEAFTDAGLPGCEFRPVDFVGIDLSGNLWELVATGTAGQPDPVCGMDFVRRCEYCGSTQYRHFRESTGLMVDENNWDGSDFFTVIPLPMILLATKRVKEIIKKNKFKGATLIPTTELGVCFHTGEDDRGEVSPC